MNTYSGPTADIVRDLERAVAVDVGERRRAVAAGADRRQQLRWSAARVFTGQPGRKASGFQPALHAAAAVRGAVGIHGVDAGVAAVERAGGLQQPG